MVIKPIIKPSLEIINDIHDWSSKRFSEKENPQVK